MENQENKDNQQQQHTQQQDNHQQDGRRISQSPFFKAMLEKAEKYLEHPKQVTALLNDAFKKASSKKSLGTLAGEIWESLQVLSRMIKAAMAGEYKGIPTSALVGGIAVIIYFISPIDLIPDFIPVIGLLDDAALLAWFMASINTELDRFKDWEVTAKPTATEYTPTDAEMTAAAAAPASAQDLDSSFGTPKYSDQSKGNVDIETKPEA